MKKLYAVVALALMASPLEFANAEVVKPAEVIRAAVLSYATSPVAALDLINWKVGDTANYDISSASFGAMGTSLKTVSKDEGTSIWVHQEMNITMLGQKQTVDMQLNKADGKVLKVIQNGQETQVPDDKIDIISQDYTTITVKAGTFKCLHVVGKTSQVKQLEVWANPRDTVMDGAVKEYVDQGMIALTLELTSFTKIP